MGGQIENFTFLIRSVFLDSIMEQKWNLKYAYH